MVSPRSGWRHIRIGYEIVSSNLLLVHFHASSSVGTFLEKNLHLETNKLTIKENCKF